MPRKNKQHNVQPVEFHQTRKYDISDVRITISAKNAEQKSALKTISENIVTFIRGYPGSGKTYLAVAYGLQKLLEGQYQQLVFTRPVVEAGGEKLGFLPGSMNDKIDPYMTPIFETLYSLIPYEIFLQLTHNKNEKKNGIGDSIRVIPLAFMRGLTLKKSFVVVDEAQNCKPEQIRMILTRLGEDTKIIMCGDINQSDILSNNNGLTDAFNLLDGLENIGFVTLTEKAIVRHPLVGQIEQRYLNRK